MRGNETLVHGFEMKVAHDSDHSCIGEKRRDQAQDLVAATLSSKELGRGA